MIYLGSKRRIAKDILPIILKDRLPNQWYVEPFVGGCNSIDKVEGRRIGNDINHYVIGLWQALQQGWQPPSEVSEDLYNSIKMNKAAYEPALVAFVGITCTFGSKWFGGYARNKQGSNYAIRAKKALELQLPLIKDIYFTAGAYENMILPTKSIIYADIPYRKTTDGYIKKFDHDLFFHWARQKAKGGHTIFVSEYTAPEDFETVWSKAVINQLDSKNIIPAIEKLFRYAG